jgi:hypothetical protein
MTFWQAFGALILIGVAGCDAPVAKSPEPTTPVAAATAPAPVKPPVLQQSIGLPAEVTAFKKQRDICDHFRGEEAYDEMRGHFIAEQLAQSCAGTDAALARLRKRYVTDITITTALTQYEDRVE